VKLVDLSLPVRSDMPHFDGTPPVYVARSHRLETEGYRMSTVVMGNHSGTHADAPSHFLADGAGVEAIPLERCIGPATVIDLSAHAPRQEITVGDLEAALGGPPQPGSRLLVRTDWDRHFGEEHYFTDFPPLALEVGDFLAAAGIWLLALDTPSLHPSAAGPLHEALLGAGVVIVESLANLASLSAREVFFAGLPIKLEGADGAPIRAVAYDGEAPRR
jgi:arylformamidase